MVEGIRDWELEEVESRRIWIPYMCDSAFVLAAALRGKNYDAEVLPRSEDKNLSLGRKYTDGEQCIPSIITTEDILQRVFSPDFNPDEEAFFQGKSEGPCRFGRYYMNQLLILKELGLENVPIITLDSKDFYGGWGRGFKLVTLNGMMGQAMLERMLHFTRPFEITKGESEKVYQIALEEFCQIVEENVYESEELGVFKILKGNYNQEIIQNLKKSKDKFLEIKRKKEDRPIIYITGEIFVRTSSVANQNLIEKIEEEGGIVLLEPVASFFEYVVQSKLERARHNVKNLKFKERVDYHEESFFMERDKKRIERIFNLPHDPSAKEIIMRGSKYIHPTAEGEAIVTLGSSDYFAESGVDGIVNAVPHNCMPGTICIAKSKELRERHGRIPFLNLSYDGHYDPSKEEQLDVFMYQVKERMKKKAL